MDWGDSGARGPSEVVRGGQAKCATEGSEYGTHECPLRRERDRHAHRDRRTVPCLKRQGSRHSC
eukprot:5397731-Alexandrium_andersonii.AAC.1